MQTVRLINHDGSFIGIMSIERARAVAHASEMDLIALNATSDPPVYKIMDAGKFKYEQEKREREQKKKQRQNVIKTKEIRFSINTQPNDIAHKTKHATTFLNDGDKVKLTITLRRREIQRKDIAKVTLNNIVASINNTINIVTTDLSVADNSVSVTIQRA